MNRAMKFEFQIQNTLIFWLFFGLQIVSAAQVRIEVEVSTALMYNNKPVYIALDYNKWNPGDPTYQLTKINDHKYFIVLKDAPDRFEYKFTQGTWVLVEGTSKGRGIPNRSFESNTTPSNLVKDKILGWEKHVTYEILVKNIPENTPKDAEIYIAGNFNNWETNNEKYRLKRDIQGLFFIRIYTDLPKIEFKFTRGSWVSVEARESGKARPNRIIKRSSNINHSIFEVNIEGWEDLMGTLHVYSILDFLLLFSVFQGLLLVLAIPLIQNANKAANRWLILSISVSALSVLFYLISNFQSYVNRFPLLVLLPDFIYFIYGPIFYFYLLKLLYRVQFLPSKWYLHFVPFLLQFFVYLPFIIQNDQHFLLELMEQKITLTYIFGGAAILGLFWNMYYWYLFRKTILAYKIEIQTNQSYEHDLNYLNSVLVIQFMVLCFWAFSILANLVGHYLDLDNIRLFENSVDLIWLSFSSITYFVGFIAINQSETFKAKPQKISIFDDILETTVKIDQKPTEPNVENYKNEVENLKTYMETQSPFKNPKITLGELAAQLNIPAHLLSKIINDHFNQNFYDFINQYRIEEFKRMVTNPKNNNFTFLGLAYTVGFNSKTAFNRSFKKITNQTPREFLNSIKTK